LEPAGVTESAQDDRSRDRTDAGSGCDDAVRVAVANQHRDALVEFFDLGGQRQRQSGLDGDVFG